MGRGDANNIIRIWGNADSMNMNSMILTNIQTSNYFKQKLSELKTYHEIVDEIYYRVNHLEPWEKGSRRTQGLTGMCGGVRGVGGGGIVSTAYCLLYKLYTLKLTRKQLVGLLNHTDSAYIRALGFMYIRYTQQPGDLWEWYAEYLDDEEEIDVKAGGGQSMLIGQMLRAWLTRLEWFDTLWPRIPLQIQNFIMHGLRERYGYRAVNDGTFMEGNMNSPMGNNGNEVERGRTRSRTRSRSPSHDNHRNSKNNNNRRRSRSRTRSRSRSRSGSRSRHRREKKSSHRHHKKNRNRSSSRSRSNSRSLSPRGDKGCESSKKSSSSRHRRHRDRENEDSHRSLNNRDRDRDRDRNRDRHDHHSPSSSSSHRHKHSSSKSSKEKERPNEVYSSFIP